MKTLLQAAIDSGISQRKLAKDINISQGTIQNILFTNTKITYETRKKIAAYFRVPVASMYDDEMQPPLPSTEPRAIDVTDEEIGTLQQKLIAAQETLISAQAELLSAHKEIARLKDALNSMGRQAAEQSPDMISDLEI